MSSPTLWIPDKAGVYFFPPVDSLIMLNKSRLKKPFLRTWVAKILCSLLFFRFLVFLGVNLALYVRC